MLTVFVVSSVWVTYFSDAAYVPSVQVVSIHILTDGVIYHNIWRPSDYHKSFDFCLVLKQLKLQKYIVPVLYVDKNYVSCNY